jgi:hypothetical protein
VVDTLFLEEEAFVALFFGAAAAAAGAAAALRLLRARVFAAFSAASTLFCLLALAARSRLVGLRLILFFRKPALFVAISFSFFNASLLPERFAAVYFKKFLPPGVFKACSLVWRLLVFPFFITCRARASRSSLVRPAETSRALW